MGRKRLNKNPKSPMKSKKVKPTNTLTIDSLFKRTDESNDSNPTTSTADQTDDLEIVLDKANICGETDVDSIIEIIDEWVNTEEEILDEDCAYITKFFIDLAGEKDKRRIKTIVDHFYESVSKREANDDWKTLYNDTIGLILNAEFEDLNFDFF